SYISQSDSKEPSSFFDSYAYIYSEDEFANKQESDKEPDYCDKNNDDIIKINALFPS
ncbi:3412_t:CDS:2, partial [Dentiscutata erythropus]